ncbi:MAG TPA: tetratricopeptide repeat protein [Candidatus Limnocylindrales bacterium]|nr:tetratricopeptide repeat protein [Candidatus Limnocylindrales bacterium]
MAAKRRPKSGGKGPRRGGGGSRPGGPGGGGGHTPGGARRPRPRLRVDRLLIALVCLAALLRLWGITDRLPDPKLGINVLEDTAVEETDRTTTGRAWTLWRGGSKPLDLNPHTGGWPALSFYVTLGIQWLYRLGYSIQHPGVDADRFASHVMDGTGSRGIFILARLIGAIIGVLTVVLTYRLGILVAGRLVGFGAALLLAVNLQHILVSQHVSDPNLLALLFVLLALFPMVRIARGRGSTADSVVGGAMIGLAGACKYVPLIVGLPFLFAHPRTVRNRAFWLGTAAAVVALFIASPYTFLDWGITLRDLTAQRNSLFSSWVGQSEFPISLPTYLLTTLPHAMGWPAYLLSIAGCVVLWRRGRAERVLVGTAAVLILVNGLLKAAQERYVLVAMPILCLAAAAGFERAYQWWRARPAPNGARLVPGALTLPALLAAVAVAWPLPELAQTRATLRLPDTRHAARRWIVAHVPPNAPMAVELYGPIFSEGERLVVTMPFFATQVPLVRPAFHPEFLDGLQYIAQSGGISDRFEADSVNYPVEVAYYKWLRAHAPLQWSSRAERASGPTIEVRSLPARISTRAERDSLFAALMPAPNHTTRLALWCHDMSMLFGKMDAPDRAEEWALRGLRVDAHNLNGNLYVALALARLREGNATGAEEAARRAIAIVPQGITAHYYLGMALREEGRLEEALSELRAAYALSVDNRIRLNVGEVLADLGRYDEAARELDAVPQGIPERATARRDLALLYINKLGRRQEGIAALTEAAELEPDPRQAAVLRAEAERLKARIP